MLILLSGCKPKDKIVLSGDTFIVDDFKQVIEIPTKNGGKEQSSKGRSYIQLTLQSEEKNCFGKAMDIDSIAIIDENQVRYHLAGWDADVDINETKPGNIKCTKQRLYFGPVNSKEKAFTLELWSETIIKLEAK